MGEKDYDFGGNNEEWMKKKSKRGIWTERSVIEVKTLELPKLSGNKKSRGKKNVES